MFVFLGPIVLQRAIGALIGHGDIHPGSSRILKPISFLWIVRQTLDGHWDFADGNAVLDFHLANFVDYRMNLEG